MKKKNNNIKKAINLLSGLSHLSLIGLKTVYKLMEAKEW